MEVEMNVALLAHTRLSCEFFEQVVDTLMQSDLEDDVADGQLIALTAIRTCYSPGKPSDVINADGQKYLSEKGKEGKRLFRHIVQSGHTSTLEHIQFTFAVENVSRALLAQLTRHRIGLGFSVQSQRFVNLSSDGKAKGFDFVMPDSIKNAERKTMDTFISAMIMLQDVYDMLIEDGIKAEDARSVLPNAAACHLTLSVNLRALLEFYKKRSSKKAQGEIRELAEKLREVVVEVEPWTAEFFEIG